MSRDHLPEVFSMHDFRISTAVYTIAILLLVAPVHAVERLSSPSEEFPSLPLPPDISLFELTEPHTKRLTVPIENVRRDSDTLPEAAPSAIQDHIVGHVAAPASVELTHVAEPFPPLPLPPDVGGLRGFRQPYPRGRNVHLTLVHREAERRGLPPEVADAVAQIESSYNPDAVGEFGEVGLMQIRPETASLLGYRGTADGLFEPETNLRYSITYLAAVAHT
jgi:Transglycosylase SLT domain